MELTAVVIARNEEKNIESCIKSLFKCGLNKKQLQIILVDSNSSDRTIEIASKYPIEIYRLDKPSIGSALNIGIDFSKAKHILKVDGDSTVPNNFVKIALKMFEKNKKVGLVTGIRKEKNPNTKIGSIYSRRFQESDKPGYITNLGGNFIFDKEAVKKTLIKFPDDHCREETLLCKALNKHGYKCLRLNTVSMVHDSTFDSCEKPNYLKKNKFYAYENAVYLKRMGISTALKEPHIILLFYLFGTTALSFLNPLFFLGMLLPFFGVMLIKKSASEAVYFYYRAFHLMYYLFSSGKKKVGFKKIK